MKKVTVAAVCLLSFVPAFAGDIVADGVRTLTDTTLTVKSETELGEGITKVVLDNATLNFDLASDVTLKLTYEAKNDSKLGIGPAGRTAKIDAALFLKPSLGNTFGKTGAGQLSIGNKVGAVSDSTTFEVFEGMVRLTSADVFGSHSGTTTNFAIKVHEGATWHNGSNHCSVGPVELTGATWISDNPAPYDNYWSETAFKGGIVVRAASTPSKIYSTSWDFLTHPLSGNPDADKCVIDVEEGADLYVYADLHDGSNQKSVLIKRGGGTLYLLGVGSWTGGTTIEAGKIVLGNAKALGTSAITIGGDVEIEVDPGVTVTCPELKGTGNVTVSGKGGITFPKKAETVTGATDQQAEPYSPLSGTTLTVGPGVTDVSIAGGTPLKLNDVVELHPGCAAVAGIRKTGGGTLILGTGLAGKYRKLLVAGGIVEFANDTCFGMNGIGNAGGVEVSGGKIRPTANYRSPKTRFTFTGEDGGLDVPQGIVFEATSNCFYCAGATVTKTGAGGWQLTSQFQSPLAQIAGTRWVIEEGRLFTTGGSTYGSHSTAWNGTIEVHENGELAVDSPNGHQPVGKLILRGGTVRTPIAQFSPDDFNAEGAGQWCGFSFNGGIKVLASEKPSRVIARACHVSHEKNLCVIDVDEGATLVMDTMLRRGYTYSPSFAWQDGNLVKAGPGTLKLLKPLSIKGLFDIRAGTVELAEGGYIDPSAQVTAGKDAKLILNDGTRYVSNTLCERGVLNEAEVWIDATRVTAADGETLSSIVNLGTARGSFGKFPKAVSSGIIPEAPKYVAKGIGGKPSFGFNGFAALALDSYTNYTDNCEMFAVGCWTNWYGAGSQGQWGGFVSLGSVKMTNNEDQYNKGVVSCYFSGADKGSVITSVSCIFGNHIDGNSEKKTANCSIGSANLKKDESFILRLHRGATSADAELWRSDTNVKTAIKSPYPVPDVQKYTRVDRVSIGSRLASGGCATTYAASSTGTRNMIGWIGEVLVFSKKLSDDERAIVNDYLRRKWIGTDATPKPEWGEKTAGALTVETPEGSKADFVASAAVGEGGELRLAKSGSGELRIGGSVSEKPTMAVQEGGVRLADAPLASRAAIWIDADDAATCQCDGENNVTNLINKGSCGGSFVRATPTGSVAMHYPKLTADSINGRKTLTFDGEAALITSCYTNRTAPRRMSVYAVWRRNSWKLHPGVENGGGYGKWATVYTFVPADGTGADENIPGVFHVDENAATSSYAEFGNYSTEGFSVPANGEVAIFTAHMTTNGYSVAHEKVATTVTKVPHKANGGTLLNIEPANIDRVILGGRASSRARVHYKGKDSTENRCWYGDLAEMVVTTEPLSVEEEASLYAYLRKKWMDKGSGSATPPTWLSGEAAAPQFDENTTLAMADGTALVHDAGEVAVGTLATEGTVDWTRVWSGEKDDYPMFDAGNLALGTVNLRSEPAVRKDQVKILDYVNRLMTPTWRIYRGDKERPNAVVSDRGDSVWMYDQVGMMLMFR